MATQEGGRQSRSFTTIAYWRNKTERDHNHGPSQTWLVLRYKELYGGQALLKNHSIRTNSNDDQEMMNTHRMYKQDSVSPIRELRSL